MSALQTAPALKEVIRVGLTNAPMDNFSGLPFASIQF
jgi:hypothetical protein